jgi:DNA-binding CsgD family transcriptional regulator
MEPVKTSTCPRSGPGTSLGNESPGRSIFSDRQWLSLARALQLSDRELQIIQCIFDDHTEATTAAQLGISTHTIHTHLERLYHKLGVNTRCAVVIRVFAEHFNKRSPRGAAGRCGGRTVQPLP